MPAGGGPRAVRHLLGRVTQTSRTLDLFEPGETVLVACSGGPDSIALLHSLQRLRRLLRIRTAVFHFDHRLRDDSAADAAYVRRQAARLKVPVHVRVADEAPRRGESVEAWARLARYAALTEVARDVGAGCAALGHTMDDQAETVLLALARGGGLDALSGMAASTTLPPLGLPAVRPLIDCTRAEVEAFCRALRLRPRIDPTNADPAFLRNRVRHDVLPLLEERIDRNVRVTLARTARRVREDAAYLEELASEAARRVSSVDEHEVALDADALAGLPDPIAARVVRQALRVAAAAAGGWDADAGSAHILAVLDLAAGRPGRRVDLPGDLVAERDRRYVRVSRPSPARMKGD